MNTVEQPAKAENMEENKFNIHMLEHTLNSISECLSITDMSDKILYVNRAFLNVYGFKREEVIGKYIDIIRSDKNDPRVVREILPHTLKGGWQGKIYNKKKDGTIFPVYLKTSIVWNDGGDPVALVGIARDLTESVKTEEVLKEAEDKYKQLFTQIKDAVYESTPEGHITSMNPAGVELFGFDSEEEMLNVDIKKDIFLNPNDRRLFKNQLATKGFVKDFEFTIKKKNGEIATVLETAFAVRDKQGRIKAYRGILRDVSQKKRAESQLKNYVNELALLNKQLAASETELKEINANKDKFFSIIAHDLRSPFTSLLGLADLMLEDFEQEDKDDLKVYAERIHKSAHNVYNLLENLLQWSRLQSGRLDRNPERFDLSEVVHQTLSLLKANAENKTIHLVNEVASKTFVNADRHMIFSVMQNLLSNSIKFTKKGGHVIVNAKFRDGDYEVTVRDNGIGIDPDVMEKLFRIDVHHSSAGTANEPGSGLGLVLSKELISQNSGKIWVESKPGEGTTFHFTLPSANRME